MEMLQNSLVRRTRLQPGLISRLFRALCILAWLIAPSVAGQMPAQRLLQGENFAADAIQARALRAPILVLFSESWCSWCERVRREYLAPMQNDPAYRERVLIREIDVSSDAALTDFSGAPTTQKSFAAHFMVRRVPVVALLGPDGKLLGEPMVGMALPDFYQTYLDDAIDHGRKQLGAR